MFVTLHFFAHAPVGVGAVELTPNEVLVNSRNIFYISRDGEATCVKMVGGQILRVEESPERILQLIQDSMGRGIL